MRKQELAQVFNQIAKGQETVETQASGILAAIKHADVKDLQGFDLLVSAAYARNGWSQRVGRPVAGDTPAPAAVKVYVSTVRAAYRMQIDPTKQKTMQDLRKALREARATLPHKKPQRRLVDDPSTAGEAAELYRALWSDILAVRVELSDVDQRRLDAAMRKTLEQFAKRAPDEVRSHLQLVAA